MKINLEREQELLRLQRKQIEEEQAEQLRLKKLAQEQEQFLTI